MAYQEQSCKAGSNTQWNIVEIGLPRNREYTTRDAVALWQGLGFGGRRVPVSKPGSTENPLCQAYCEAVWDSVLCWPSIPAGQTAWRSCQQVLQYADIPDVKNVVLPIGNLKSNICRNIFSVSRNDSPREHLEFMDMRGRYIIKRAFASPGSIAMAGRWVHQLVIIRNSFGKGRAVAGDGQ
ncbi:hypothetical protein AVEN_213028-1 [Araneus ventricosus]|uniref:G-protein coupled receptors family 2 profile 1 domain-containing protein n=1 Tax=Araneus ventricosus TaxID=182803 RepID=A0A4Y2QTG0_ARAVE|nr:hypothetical protein AVEN_213028-1 [Araneus ventricosus]